MSVGVEQLAGEAVAAPPAVATNASVAQARTGTILLARHGEPSLSRRVKLDSDGYRRWWARYEEGGLLSGQEAPPELIEAAGKAAKVYASVRKRSIETAGRLRLDGQIQVDEVFVEAPLPPPRFPSWVKMSPRAWGFISRFWWWWFNHHAGEESRAQAEQRAARASETLIAHAEAGHDVMVVAHGFFNAMIGLQLKARGWKCVSDGGYGYWSARKFERR